MFNNNMNKKNEKILNNQNVISNMRSQFGGDSGDNESNEQYKQYHKYSEDRNLYDKMMKDFKDINRITGGNNISDIFMETQAIEREEKGNYKELQNNMIAQQKMEMKIGGCGKSGSACECCSGSSGSKGGGSRKLQHKELRKEFQKKIKEGNKHMKKLYKLHDKAKKQLGKKRPIVKHKPSNDFNNFKSSKTSMIPQDIRETLLADIRRIAKKFD
jgi:uncharacterized protein YukE